MALAENNNGDGDIYGMDSYIQATGVDVAIDDGNVNQNEESSSVIEKNQVQSRTGGISTMGFSDHSMIDIIVECTQYDESLQECLDRMDNDEKAFEINLANAILNVQYDFVTEQTQAIYNMVSSAHVETFGQIDRLTSIISRMETTANSINNLMFNFRIDGGGSSSNANDGYWAKLVKGIYQEETETSSEMYSLRNQFDYLFKTDSHTTTMSDKDGMFTRFLKYSIARPLGDVEDDTESIDNAIRTIFNVGKVQPADFDGDGSFIKLFKLAMRDNRDQTDELKAIRKSVNQFWVEDGSPTAISTDGNFGKLMKGMRTDIRTMSDLIKNGGSGGGASAESIFEVFEDSLKDFQKSFDKMVKYLKDFEFTGEGGTNLWDVLESMIKELGDGFTGLLDTLGDLLDFTESMMDFFIEVFVPKENVIKDGFDGLNQLIAEKFKSTTALKDVINSTFSQSQKDFANINVTLPKYGNVKILETSYLNTALPVARDLIGGAMILITSIWAYRKITTELIT